VSGDLLRSPPATWPEYFLPPPVALRHGGIRDAAALHRAAAYPFLASLRYGESDFRRSYVDLHQLVALDHHLIFAFALSCQVYAHYRSISRITKKKMEPTTRAKEIAPKSIFFMNRRYRFLGAYRPPFLHGGGAIHRRER